MTPPAGLRLIEAGNAGPFTLGGTRTHVVGRRVVAVVDPGPDLPGHVDAVAEAVAGADSVTLLVTHGHRDHAGAAPALAARLGVPVAGAWGGHPEEGGAGAGGPPPGLAFRTLADGDAVATDAGELVAVHTPGHTPEHLCFRWPVADAVFVGDLLLGEGETTWVADYPGCVADYLASLDRVEALAPGLLLPAHGPPIPDPAERLDRFRRHRLRRIEQVRRALAAAPGATPAELVETVYGDVLPPGLRAAARLSVAALVEYVHGHAGA